MCAGGIASRRVSMSSHAVANKAAVGSIPTASHFGSTHMHDEQGRRYRFEPIDGNTPDDGPMPVLAGFDAIMCDVVCCIDRLHSRTTIQKSSQTAQHEHVRQGSRVVLWVVPALGGLECLAGRTQRAAVVVHVHLRYVGHARPRTARVRLRWE